MTTQAATSTNFITEAALGDAIANIEAYRMKELSRGMIQQVYNNSTYRLEIWSWLHTMITYHRSEGVNMGPMLSWQYVENTIRCQPFYTPNSSPSFSLGSSTDAETFHLITGERVRG